jgi:hypothetical protein
MNVKNIAVGDIFDAKCPNGARPICLAVAVTDSIIRARSITNDQHFEFDRLTGTGVVIFNGKESSCAIHSATPLPLDIHNILLGLDRKSRLEEDPERMKLNEDEKRALLYVMRRGASKKFGS